jgi:large subunit ribosomal protein L1
MEKRSKRYQDLVKGFDFAKEYSLEEGVGLLCKLPSEAKAKFDETVELSMHLGVDPKQSDQMVRGTVNLPHGSGKKVRVLVFTENPQLALDAGADYAGLGDILKKIQDENWMDFDVALSTTSAMKEVRNVARVLGPRGLMPNPKSGTVTDDIVEGVRMVRAGRVEFKMDKTANVAVVIGKKSFTAEQLMGNAAKVIEEVRKARPASFKGHYVKSVTLASTMSPGIPLLVKEFFSL